MSKRIESEPPDSKATNSASERTPASMTGP